MNKFFASSPTCSQVVDDTDFECSFRILHCYEKKLIDSVLNHVLVLFFDPFFEQGAMYIMISDTQLF